MFQDDVVGLDTKPGEIMRLFAEYCRLTEFIANAMYALYAIDNFIFFYI